MAVATFNFTTGPAALPDIGNLSYNGCVFSPLFESNISGKVIKDRANRTTKSMEYTLTVDGYVTLRAGDTDVDVSMTNLRQLLTVHGGDLVYRGRGLDLEVNTKHGDVAWGPVPELLDFQPLGAGRSAKVQWSVKVTITEPPFARIVAGENVLRPLLQFNYETSLMYGDDGFSSLSIKGTMEIPMTRSPSQKTRTLATTVDSFRTEIQKRIMSGFDMSQFRWIRRDFNVSRDKRTLEWDFLAEEVPYMNLPPGCTVARGNYNVRPMQTGMGLAKWLCTLRATYTARNDVPRRTAWLSFLALLRVRMAAAEHGSNVDDGKAPNVPLDIARNLMDPTMMLNPARLIPDLVEMTKKTKTPVTKSKANLIDFTIDEGVYLDSKTVSFSATWWIVTHFTHILRASGLWKKVPEENVNGGNLWAIAMRDINGVRSWLPNRLDPTLDVIVDFGGG